MTRRRRSAFTLLEIVLVITLLVMLMAISVPYFDRLYGDMKLDAAADQIRARWADARARAMEEAQPYLFAVVPGEGRFRVAPERGDYWGGGTDAEMEAAPLQIVSERPPLVVEETLPDSILFSMMATDALTTGGWAPVAVFLPDGTARDDVTVQLNSEGFRPVILNLRGLTGSVTVYRSDDLSQMGAP